MQEVDRIIIARRENDVSTSESSSEHTDLAALVSPSSPPTSGTGDLAHPGSLIPPTSDQMDPVASVSPSFSLSHTHKSPAGDLANN